MTAGFQISQQVMLVKAKLLLDTAGKRGGLLTCSFGYSKRGECCPNSVEAISLENNTESRAFEPQQISQTSSDSKRQSSIISH